MTASSHAPAARLKPASASSGERPSRLRHEAVKHRARLLAGYALLSIAVGGLLHLASASAAGDAVWRLAVALLAAELALEVGRTVLADHHMASTRSP